MPRRRIDTTTEHRLTLGEYERGLFERALQVQVENQRLDAATATAQAVGTALAGFGGVMAGLALMAWKAPDILEAGRSVVFGALDDITDAILPGTPIAFRREAQALARRRGEISARINRFCTSTSPDYDGAACSLAHDEKDAYFADLEDFRERVRQANIERDSVFWNFIFGGLGDIEPTPPRPQTPPTTGGGQAANKADERAWWEKLLGSSPGQGLL